MDKSEVRRQALAARKAIPPEQCSAWSRAIHTHLAQFPDFSHAQYILTYLDSKDNEVQTRPLITDLLQQGKCVLVPRCIKGARLEWCKITSLDDIILNSFGIYEPISALPAQAPPPDSVCLVPGIAFRSDAHRIGYGGGYFDRFLADYQGTSIGLAFQLQLRNDWQPSPHDIPVSHVVSEQGLN